MNIGIIGTSGEIGFGLTRFLQNHTSHKIVPITRSNSELKEKNKRICDLRNPHQIPRALEEIDVVINLSGRITGIHYEDFYIDNYICSINLFRACLKAKVKRLIQLSSILAISHPETAYGKTKALTDNFFLAQTDLSLIVLRPSWIITSSPKSLIQKFIKMVRFSPVLLVPRTGRMQPIFEAAFYALVRDCVEKTFEKKNTKTIYCVGSESLNLKEFFKTLSSSMNKKRLIFEYPLSILINLVKLSAMLCPSLSSDLEKLQIQKSDRIHSKICAEMKKYQRPIKDEMMEFLDSMGGLP